MEEELANLVHEVFDASMPRLGPGDDASTARALDTVLPALERPEGTAGSAGIKILDIGCGNGAQTLQLARQTDGTILAVDNHQPYLDELERRTRAAGVAHRVRTRLMDMRDLGPDEGPYDLIWSEGAIYFLGFREGLAACHRLLAPHGVLAVTELTWLKPEPPAECHEFFAAEYPVMADVDTNLATVRACGYEVLSHFTLPESAWLDDFYLPLEQRLPPLRDKYSRDPDKLAIIDATQAEIDMYRNHSSHYGYVFYLMRRGAASPPA